MATLDDWIRNWFNSNYSYMEILLLLKLERNVRMSYRHLKRHLRRLGLRRRGNWNANNVQRALKAEIEGSGRVLGCRAMSRRLSSKHGISIGRDAVLRLQRLLDPEGVDTRARHCLTRRVYFNKGPNYLVHVDGYDKLKRYGFGIHGALCGFSRRVLWLNVSRTNNDPRVIASYFLNYLEEIQGIPRCIRVDAGTENGYMINMQKSLRWHHEDDRCGEKSVIIGSSPSNQRIERWWRSLREMGIGFWIDIFKDMDDEGVFSTANPVHIECLRFCFMQIIQGELDEIRTEWNQHKIRTQGIEGSPDGKPDMLFFHPELFGTAEYKYPVNIADIQALKSFCDDQSTTGCTEAMHHRFISLLHEGGRQQPATCQDAVKLLAWLIPQL